MDSDPRSATDPASATTLSLSIHCLLPENTSGRAGRPRPATNFTLLLARLAQLPGVPAAPGTPLPPTAVAVKLAGAWIDAAPPLPGLPPTPPVPAVPPTPPTATTCGAPDVITICCPPMGAGGMMFCAGVPAVPGGGVVKLT